MTALNDRMNESLDIMIQLLQDAKTETYTRKLEAVREVTNRCDGYVFFWEEKLADWASDAADFMTDREL